MENVIKVLLADDSVVVRRLLKEVLEQDKRIKVVHQSKDGADAVRGFATCKPDVVLLDVEMPVMSGIQAATAIHALNPKVPIIMFSSVTTQGAEATLDALSQGACDYEAKPSMVGHISEAHNQISTQLVPKIINWGERYKTPSKTAPISRREVRRGRSPVSTADSAPFEVVAVGVSTGGPQALREFLEEFPRDFGAPIVVVQHMPPVFTRILAERLNDCCKLTIGEAKAGSVLMPGKAWIAPGDFHMKVSRDGSNVIARLNQNEQVNFCRPAVDVLFKSVVQTYGSATLGVVLTGMGSDGLEGCRAIQASRGQIMAQDRESSAVWGMPGAVVGAELATSVLPPRELAQKIVKLHANRTCLQN